MVSLLFINLLIHFHCLALRIYVFSTTWLEHVYKVFIGSSSVDVVSGVLAGLLFFRIFFMCQYSLATEGCRCFIRSAVRLVYVEKWPFFMDWIIFLWTGVNRVAWYHCSSSVLVIAQRALSAAGCFWLGRWSVFLVSLTCHILYMFYQVPFNTVKSSFTTLM